MNDWDDVFETENNSHRDGAEFDIERELRERESNALRVKMENAGYKEGIIAAKDAAMQKGFEDGFDIGSRVGYTIGRLKGNLRGARISIVKGFIDFKSIFGEEAKQEAVIKEIDDLIAALDKVFLESKADIDMWLLQQRQDNSSSSSSSSPQTERRRPPLSSPELEQKYDCVAKSVAILNKFGVPLQSY